MKVVYRYLLYSFYYRRQRNLLKTVTRSLILLICSCVISNQLFQIKKTISLVSRILFLNHHLSSCAILTQSCCLPWNPSNKLESNEPLSKIPIHGITTPKVYPPLLLPTKAVSSYLTFSPVSAFCKTEVIFCGTISRLYATIQTAGA